jgi:peptidyl-prolyl cis-trans isomerase SurA
MKRPTLLAFILILILAGSASGEQLSAIAAVVNDDVVTTLEVEKESALLIREAEREKKEPLGEPEREKMRSLALAKLIDKRLVEQKVRELGIRVGDDDIKQAIEDVKRQNNLTQEAFVLALKGQGLTLDEYRAQLKEQLERLRLVSMEVKAKIQVGEREMREYYQANAVRFGGGEVYRARHILFRLDKKATSAEIKRIMEHALTVLYEARSGTDFDTLVRKYSEDPNAQKNGGDLGTFRRGELVAEIEEAVSGMKAGDVSDLVSTALGLHIIRLDSRQPGTPKPFDQVKAEVEDILYRKKSEERFNRWVADLRDKAAIEVRRGTLPPPPQMAPAPGGATS